MGKTYYDDVLKSKRSEIPSGVEELDRKYSRTEFFGDYMRGELLAFESRVGIGM